MEYTNMSNEQLEQLLRQKDFGAVRELAQRCRTGTKGQEKNLTRAANLYHKGEKQGLSWAYKALGDMYANGEGFAQNTEIANEYYAKAGVSGNVQDKTETFRQINNSSKVDCMTVYRVPERMDKNQIRQMLDEGEDRRRKKDIDTAKQMAKQALEQIRKIRENTPEKENLDLDELEAHAYWLLAYAAYNQKKFQKMEDYLHKPGVYALHPWGAYLLGISHQMNGAPDSVLEKDLKRLLQVSRNPNMTLQEKGDVLGLIGDFYLEDLGDDFNDSNQLAYTYYKEAEKCGNQYASEQAEKFKTSIFGQVKYTG